jgi:hypothetical protein
MSATPHLPHQQSTTSPTIRNLSNNPQPHHEDCYAHTWNRTQETIQCSTLFGKQKRFQTHSLTSDHCTERLGSTQEDRTNGQKRIDMLLDPRSSKLSLDPSQKVVHTTGSETVAKQHHTTARGLLHLLDHDLDFAKVSVARLQHRWWNAPIVRRCFEGCIGVANVLQHFKQWTHDI